jgi:hypothetical protein
MIARSLRFVALSLALLPAACGSSSPEGTTVTTEVACQSGQFRLLGELDGQTVNLTASSTGSGLSQVGVGELTVDANPDPSAPARPQLDLTWPQGLIDGASSAASGTLIPVDGPLAGQTLCVGAGTTVTVRTGNNGVGFELKGFASGANCETPVDGDVYGCWD